MGSRFGRNQKRKMREEIERLRKLVAQPCGVATGCEREIASLGQVRYVESETASDSYQGDRKTLSVTFSHIYDSALIYRLHQDREVLQFQGARYLLDEVFVDIETMGHRALDIDQTIRIKFKGVL